MNTFFRNIVVRFRFFMFRFLRPILRVFYTQLWNPKDEIEKAVDAFSSQHKSVKFLQIGTNDGLINDPIVKFIVRDKWQGVRVEPLDAPLQFLNFLHGGNDGVEIVQCLVGTEAGTAPIYQISFSKSRWATGIASLDRNNLERVIQSGYVEEKAKKYNEKLPANKTDWIAESTLGVREINEFISSHFPNGIDMLQMDVEGLDHDLIMALDLNLHTPDLIVFERVNLDAAQFKACETKLIERGYTLICTEVDTLAYKPSQHKIS